MPLVNVYLCQSAGSHSVSNGSVGGWDEVPMRLQGRPRCIQCIQKVKKQMRSTDISCSECLVDVSVFSRFCSFCFNQWFQPDFKKPAWKGSSMVKSALKRHFTPKSKNTCFPPFLPAVPFIHLDCFGVRIFILNYIHQPYRRISNCVSIHGLEAWACDGVGL